MRTWTRPLGGIPLLTLKSLPSASSSQSSALSSFSLYRQNRPCREEHAASGLDDCVEDASMVPTEDVQPRCLTLNLPTNLSSVAPSSSLAFPLNSSYVFTQSLKEPNSASSSLSYSCRDRRHHPKSTQQQRPRRHRTLRFSSNKCTRNSDWKTWHHIARFYIDTEYLFKVHSHLCKQGTENTHVVL